MIKNKIDDIYQIDDSEGGHKNFLSHLDDIKVLLIKLFVAVLAGLIGCFAFAPKMFRILLVPYEAFLASQERFDLSQAWSIKSLSPYEALTMSMKLSLIVGIVVVSPYIIYLFWQYVQPALRVSEKKYLSVFIFLSPLLFAGGVVFCYFLVLPLALIFLWKYSLYLGVYPDWTVSYYMNFVIGFLFAFGVSFQLPVVIMILTRLRLITPAFLAAKRKHAIILIFIGAALLTPADLCSQWLLGLPMIALYEFSIILSKIMK